jgi:hypothetical protein
MKSGFVVLALLATLSLGSQVSMFEALSSKLKAATTTAGVFDTVLDMVVDLRD